MNDLAAAIWNICAVIGLGCVCVIVSTLTMLWLASRHEARHGWQRESQVPTPSLSELRKLAAKHPPPDEWYDDDEGQAESPIEEDAVTSRYYRIRPIANNSRWRF